MKLNDDLVQEKLQSQAAYIRELERRNELLTEYILQMERRTFGASADKLKFLATQPSLFNEAEQVSDATAEVEESERITQVSAHKRNKGGRKALPENLPRETVVHDLPDHEKVCCECHQAMERIGVDTTEKLEYVPATVRVVVHERPKYSCKQCECAPKQASPEPQAIPKSIATASLLSHVLVSKFIDATPLYRQEQQWKRLGIEISRALLSNWVVKCGDLLFILWLLMRDDLRGAPLVQADETRLQVLKEAGRTADQQSYMWLFQSGPPGKRIILYHYAPSRAGEVPSKMLGEAFSGYLQTDGYSGYHDICSRPNVTGVGCWAHARRKFVDAGKIVQKRGLAHDAVAMISMLYAVEKQAKEMSDIERHALRMEKARPVLEQFKAWLDEHEKIVIPKSALGKAITYARNEWTRLTTYQEDGRIEIDNNAAERSIKPFVIGRKNWLFCNAASGATASAVIYSLLQSAKANELPVSDWMTFVLKELPRCTTVEEKISLLPHRFDVNRLNS